ncbi:helix-turn-helix transcriptional regulator [Vibrio fluvialis]|nr:helix-turn-helix transcriptional regulator [Vibrio fluvialis]MBY7937991.1 helix-turn-helix domain-containing protein [Vibrio fluvialis]
MKHYGLVCLFSELSNKAIDRSYVGRIERGEVNITLEKAYQIAEVLRCDVRNLLP